MNIQLIRSLIWLLRTTLRESLCTTATCRTWLWLAARCRHLSFAKTTPWLVWARLTSIWPTALRRAKLVRLRLPTASRVRNAQTTPLWLMASVLRAKRASLLSEELRAWGATTTSISTSLAPIALSVRSIESRCPIRSVARRAKKATTRQQLNRLITIARNAPQRRLNKSSQQKNVRSMIWW